jgi:hypothetical protein
MKTNNKILYKIIFKDGETIYAKALDKDSAKIFVKKKFKKDTVRSIKEVARMEHIYNVPIFNLSGVVCLNDKKQFKSAAEASAYYGIDPSHVTKVCKGKRPSTGGRKFRYVKEL